MPDDRAAHLRVLRRRGHAVDAHLVSATARLTPALPAPADIDGIAVTTLATTRAPQAERQLYRLQGDTVADNPGFADRLPDFDTWRAEALGGEGFRAHWVLLAEHGRRIVAVTAVRATPDPHTGHVDHTAVERPWRGRGLARALKLHAARRLFDDGLRLLHTEVEAANAPMLAVNAALGYRPGPGHHRTVKTL
ncbi:GNAT family N-acetyltransferase [Kitasatospora sp. NPDC101235]|uniref:GNAT family N-acetyltransferase n=1 Tax=Kitasatospora sp. NPDC101235 TaxID=3364101 RepID=UPI003826320A